MMRTRLPSIAFLTSVLAVFAPAAARGADGGNPYGPLVADSAGTLYGTAEYGGSSNLGVVFALSPSNMKSQSRLTSPQIALTYVR